MTSMNEFFTRDTANEGKRVYLHSPDGVKTEHWVLVRSVDSDAYEQAKIQRDRALLDAPSSDDDEAYNAFIRETRLNMIASVIAGWSFDEELTPENVRVFLDKAPQIAREIEQLSSSRSFFYTGSASSSAPSRKSASKKAKR